MIIASPQVRHTADSRPAARGIRWRPGRPAATARCGPSPGASGAPDDPARLIAWLATDEAGWITGEVINSEGGFRR